MDRDQRKALRRRGVGSRTTDVNDVVIEAPPAETLAFSPAPEVLERASKDIVKKHSRLTRLRRERRKRDRQERMNAVKQRKSTTNKAKAMVGAMGVRIKYRRVPHNRAKLMGLDILGQIIVDFFKSNELATMIGRKLVENSKVKDKTLVRNQTRTFFKDYIQQITSYFTSLIDLKLTNQLLLTDLHKVNREKDEARSNVFATRNQRSELAIQLKDLREEFALLRRETEHQKSLVKKFATFKDGSLVDRVKYKVDVVANGLPVSLCADKSRAHILLEKLTRFNDALEKERVV